MSVDQFLLSADTTDLNYPEIRPTLDLNFARSKTLDPRITFTRASGGSYLGADGLIKYAGVNQPRFDHDIVTSESLGLLVEESRSNLLPRSEEFSGSGWSTSNSSIIPNAITSPDGINTAVKLVENTANGNHAVIRGSVGPLTAGTTYTFSAFVKAGERNFVMLYMVFGFPTEISAVFNLKTGESVITRGSSAPSAILFPNGWWRISITATSSGGVTSARILLSDRSVVEGNTPRYSGDGTSGVYIWGAQIEQGAFPTSYIPTQASTRIRAADDASITGKNFSDFYRQDEGTVFVDVYNDPLLPTGIALNFSDFGNFGSNRIQMIRDGNVAYLVNNVVTLNNTSATSTNLLRYKLLTSYNLNDIVIAANGSYVTRPGEGTPPQNITTMTIGSYPGGASKINKSISRIIYFPKRLPNEQLQALTR